MALWTDPSRQYLINSIRNRPVVWDKNYVGESNYRTLKNSAFRDVTDEMNRFFVMTVKFTCEDVRSQWKNLKDTFVRKLRWFHEGKYMEDAMKEPTWKFYRMLIFLDEKEAKRLGDTVEHTYELAPASSSTGGTNGGGGGGQTVQSMHHKDRQQATSSRHQPSSSTSMMPIAYEPTSSEEQMLQMFNQPPISQQQQQQHQLIATESKPVAYSPTSQNGSSSGVEEDEEEEEEEEEPRRKRHYPRHQVHNQVFHNASLPIPGQTDEWEHFGALVTAHLRRLYNEQGTQSAIRLQKKLSEVLFSED